MPEFRLLIVEDDPKSLYAFRSVLQERGFDVVAFHSAEEALPFLREPFDAALLDVRLPRMQGGEFASLLRNQQPSVRLVFVTAYNGVTDLREQFPDSTVLVKPINLKQLFSLL